MSNHDLPVGNLAETKEARRLAVLDGLDILDTTPEAAFDTIVDCARRLLGCKIALFSLVGSTRQWFKAKCGLDTGETPRADSFCAVAIEQDDLFVIPDAMRDPRFANNPLVVGAPNIRFYAGVPVHAADPLAPGNRLPMGTICVIDDRPRQLSADEAAVLRRLGALAESLLAARGIATRASIVAEERRVMLHDLDVTHRQFRQAERMANIGSWRLTLEDERTEWSDQVYAIHGLPCGVKPRLDEALTFYPPQSRADIAQALANTIETHEPFNLEADFVTAQGAARRVLSMGELELCDGKPVAVIGVLQDITSRHRMEQHLLQRANRDDLTGLANRARFNTVVDDAIATARARGTPLALALIDLDHFKALNDSQGHLAGDDVLRLMGARLNAAYLGGAFAARLGGDEFVLLFSRPDGMAGLAGVLERLSADLRHLASLETSAQTVSATIGATWYDRDVCDRSDFLHRADIALYEAKRQCRGTVRIYRPEMEAAATAASMHR